MRTGVSFTVSPTARHRLEAVIADRNSAQKHVWRYRIILGTADRAREERDHAHGGHGQDSGVALAGALHDGLLRDKTRPSRIPPLKPEVAEGLFV